MTDADRVQRFRAGTRRQATDRPEGTGYRVPSQLELDFADRVLRATAAVA